MAVRRRREEPENHERWLVSYADFITLLFAFFVVMYSVSSVNEGKMRVLSDTLMASFQSRQKSLEPVQVGELVRSPYVDTVSAVTSPVVTPAVAGPAPVDTLAPFGPDERWPSDADPGELVEEPDGADDGFEPGEGSLQAGDVETIAGRMEEAMGALLDEDLVRVRREERWVEVELNTNVLFASGEAVLSPDAVALLARMAAVLREFANPIQVEGFTDDVPIQTLQFPSNWELSAARAASVVHLFMKNEVHPERMVAVGYGEHRPAADNATAEGRRRNRRVVLVIPVHDAAERRGGPIGSGTLPLFGESLAPWRGQT